MDAIDKLKYGNAEETMAEHDYEATRRQAAVTGVTKLPCMCGEWRCRYCGKSVSNTCAYHPTHCPHCGAPTTSALNSKLGKEK